MSTSWHLKKFYPLSNEMYSTRNHQKAFTLVELAIVLVIIGLIVGGVLVGQDMIKAAEIRSTVGQVEKFNAAVNTFRNKYNGLPGDVRNPGNLGFAATGATGAAAGLANGNGVIESAGVANGFLGEPPLFWTHLSQANLIEGSTGIMTDYAAIAGTITDAHMPQAKIGKGLRYNVTGINGINHFVLSVFVTTGAGGATSTSTNGMSPVEAFQIDSKLDDGKPDTGIVISIDTGSTPTLGGGASNPTQDDCYDSDAPTIYALNDPDAAPALGCQLRIRTAF